MPPPQASSSDGIETLDPTVYSRLDPSNPLFMKRASGSSRINGQEVHFLAEATPVNFSFNIARAPDGSLVDLDSTRFGVQTSYLIQYSTEPNGTAEVNDIEVKQLTRASEQGPAFDRYFKFISEQTLRAYGARMDLDVAGNVQYNADGEVLYTWEGVTAAAIRTANNQPLTTLDGQAINAAGYYDFTRRGDTGDGGVFEYVTLADGLDYIKSVTVHFTDNMFGDNSPDTGVIVDPGVPVALLPVIGNGTSITTSSNTSFLNEGGLARPGANVVNDSSTLTIALGSSSRAASERLDPSLLATSGRSSAAMTFGGTLSWAGDGGDGEGLANADGAATAQLAGVSAAAGQGSPAMQALLGRGLDQGPKRQPDRSSLLQPQINGPASAEATAGHGSFVVGRLQEGSLMGNHLLDALALGMGVVYGFYGPKAALASNAGMRGLLRRAQQVAGIGFGTAAGRERQLISVFAIKLDNGSERLVAARVTSTGLVILAQQDLPPGAGMATPGSQAQIDYGMRQLLERLRGSGLAQAEQVLVDPQLQAQTSLLKGLGTSTAQLVTRSLSDGLARCSAEQRQQLQQWLQNPSQPLADDNPLAQLMQQRAESYAKAMPAKQASMATLVELSLALAANPGTVS